MKETTKEKTILEKAKESFDTALMSAGIVLVVLFLLWIPFKLIPAIYSGGSNYISTTLSSFLISEDSTSTQKINIDTKVNNNSIVNTNTSPNSETSYSNIQIQPTYYGKSDLQISLVSTGIIDPTSKQFVQTNYVGFNDEIAIKFEVKNTGTNITGPWKLRINSPSRTTPYYDSAYQTSLKPRDRLVYITNFDSPITTGVNVAYITIDPLNMVDEVSENNNFLTIPIKIEDTSYNYNNNYNYGNGVILPNLFYESLYAWTNTSVRCYANPQTSYRGSPITWYAVVSGGNEYYTYSWTGTDLLYSRQNAVSAIYYTSGTKTASVTVTSNGQPITAQCSAYIY